MFTGTTFNPLEGGKGLLNVLLEVLDKDDRLPFEQEIESFFGTIDFQESIDDEDDSREDSQVDGRETSFYLILSVGQDTPRPDWSQGHSVLGWVF